jgi:hypothetical protein
MKLMLFTMKSTSKKWRRTRPWPLPRMARSWSQAQGAGFWGPPFFDPNWILGTQFETKPCVYIYIHTYIHTYIYIYHIYIHIYICSSRWWSIDIHIYIFLDCPLLTGRFRFRVKIGHLNVVPYFCGTVCIHLLGSLNVPEWNTSDRWLRSGAKILKSNKEMWTFGLLHWLGVHWRELCFTFLGMALCALLVAAHFISSKEKLWETHSVQKLETTLAQKG